MRRDLGKEERRWEIDRRERRELLEKEKVEREIGC